MIYKNLIAIAVATGSMIPLGNYAFGADKKQIVMAWENMPRTFDPRYGIDANSQNLSDLVHCALIAFDENGTTKPYLAKGWKWINKTDLEVTLKKGIKFGDGTPVTSEAVKATYDFFARKDLKKPSPIAGAFRKVKAVVAKKGKVTFKLQEPDSTFPSNLMIGILPKSASSLDMVDGKTKIKGCGPFNLDSVGVSQITLKRNPGFALGKPAKADQILIKIVKDETTRFAKLRKGEVDIIQNLVNREIVAKVAREYPSLKVQRKPGLKTSYLGFNVRDRILGNAEVRKAISLAVNRDNIIRFLLNGLAVPAKTMLTPDDPFLDQTLPSPKYDPKEASKLLDAAGFKKKGRYRFTLTYKTTQNATRISIAKAIASDLKRVGIEVKVQPLEWGRFKADVEAGRVQLWSLAWVGFKDPDIFRYAFATESFVPNGGNRGMYSNKDLDQLLTQGIQVTNFKKRKSIYDKVQKIVAQELPYVFLWHEENFVVMQKSVQGYAVYADGRYSSLRNVSKE